MTCSDNPTNQISPMFNSMSPITRNSVLIYLFFFESLVFFVFFDVFFFEFVFWMFFFGVGGTFFDLFLIFFEDRK